MFFKIAFVGIAIIALMVVAQDSNGRSAQA